MPNSQKNQIVNLEYLSTISDGNQAFEKSMLEMYLKLTPKELGKMRVGLAESDYSVLQNGAHKLVSSVGLIGAAVMKEKLLSIELIAMSKSDLDKISVLLHEIEEEHNKVTLELNQILNELS